VACRKKFISIWNEIKKFLSFMGKTTAVDQLNDATAFPWFLNLSKNLSADYRKCKSNQWNYLISIHDFKNLNELITPNEKDPIDERIYLIKKYNERLLFYSDDTNPWVIDDRDNSSVVLYRKNYLEFEKKLTLIINEEIENKISSKNLVEKNIQLERKRLSHLARLALLKTYKEESIAKSGSSAITCLDSQAAINQFTQLITLEVSFASIQHEIKQIKKQQEKIVSELCVHFLKETESVRIYSITSIWEKVNKFVIKNKGMQFFSLLWYGFSSHANLLNWISFLLLFFSLSLYSYPIIFLMLGISLASYLILRLFYLVKKDSIIFTKISTDETDQILEAIKIEVFNEEKNKKEFKLIQEIVFDLSKKKLNLPEFLNSISSLQKNFDPIYCPDLSIQQSKLYQYLTAVYPKTQFIASLIVNLTSVILYTYLLTWAIQGCLTVLGAVSLAAIISSPLAVGSLILIVAGVFLIHHLFEFLAREVFYQRTILNKLNEMCEYHYKDEYGRQQVIQLEKWKKFEYLQDNIGFLELEFKSFFEENRLVNLNNKFYSLFNSYILKKNVYNPYEQDKVLGDSGLFFKSVKKFLNRFFAFSGGGFYGYNLTQQIVWKSNLGMHTLVKTLTLPILLIFIPFIIINAIANFITYHLHSRQRNRFEMAKYLDSKLEVLEQTNKKLLFLATLLSLELKHSTNFDINWKVNPEIQSVLLSNKNKYFSTKTDHFSFFKEHPKKITCSAWSMVKLESNKFFKN
jgi:hypothetical protein